MEISCLCFCCFFFFNDTATTEIYTLSLHDALPISRPCRVPVRSGSWRPFGPQAMRSEEHTSELQSREKLVCRLLIEKKKKNIREWVSERRQERPRTAAHRPDKP